MKFGLFFSDEFLTILAKVYKLSLLPVSEQLGCPVFASALFPRRRAFVLPFGFYQTAEYLASLDVVRRWEAVKEFSTTTNTNVSLTSVGEIPLESGLYIANNPILDLGGVDDELSFCSKNHRQNIRKERNKAFRNGIEVTIGGGIGELRKFYDVLARQYVRDHKMLFQPFSLYERLLSGGFAELIVAKQDQKVVGGMFCLRDGEVFHYNWGARMACSNMNIGTLLIDHAVHFAVAKGFRYFDFGSTPLTDNDLYQFKMKWGCENHMVHKYFSLAAMKEFDLNESYGSLRTLYSKTPVPIAKVVMPFVVPLLVR